MLRTKQCSVVSNTGLTVVVLVEEKNLYKENILIKQKKTPIKKKNPRNQYRSSNEVCTVKLNSILRELWPYGQLKSLYPDQGHSECRIFSKNTSVQDA